MDKVLCAGRAGGWGGALFSGPLRESGRFSEVVAFGVRLRVGKGYPQTTEGAATCKSMEKGKSIICSFGCSMGSQLRQILSCHWE